MNGRNERVKRVREYLNITQDEFGRQIGIKSRSHISAIESGARNVTDRIANDICRAYGINKEWLFEGKGEMRSFNEDEFIDKVLQGLGDLDPLDMEIIKLYLRLDGEHKKAFRLLTKGLIDKKD